MGAAIGTLALPAVGGAFGTAAGCGLAGLVGKECALQGSELGFVAMGGDMSGAATGAAVGAGVADVLFNNGQSVTKNGLIHQREE